LTFSAEQDKEGKNFSWKESDLENSGITARKTAVINELGMHARPAARIAQMAEQAQDEIRLCVDGNKVDATSVIDILTLCAVKGTRVLIEIDNKADTAVLEQIVDYFENGFGE
jgi:phosphocarrier protein HPr